jgi:hypothetical protein
MADPVEVIIRRRPIKLEFKCDTEFLPGNQLRLLSCPASVQTGDAVAQSGPAVLQNGHDRDSPGILDAIERRHLTELTEYDATRELSAGHLSPPLAAESSAQSTGKLA